LIYQFNEDFYKSIRKHFVPGNQLTSDDIAKQGQAAIGSVFKKLIDNLKLFKQYASNISLSLEKHFVNRKKNNNYDKLVSQAEAGDRCAGTTLKDFLVKPVERIIKYPSILKELLECTPETHPDYSITKKTIHKTNGVSRYVDKIWKQYESSEKFSLFDEEVSGYPEKMIDSLSTRSFLKDEILSNLVVDSEWKVKEDVQRHIYLFSDIVVLTKPQKKKKESYKETLGLLEVTNVFAKYNSDIGHSFVIQHKNVNDFVFQCNTVVEQKAWIAEVKKAIKDLNDSMDEKPTTDRSEVSEVSDTDSTSQKRKGTRKTKSMKNVKSKISRSKMITEVTVSTENKEHTVNVKDSKTSESEVKIEPTIKEENGKPQGPLEEKLALLETELATLKAQVKKLKSNNIKYKKREEKLTKTISELLPLFDKLSSIQTSRKSVEGGMKQSVEKKTEEGLKQPVDGEKK